MSETQIPAEIVELAAKALATESGEMTRYDVDAVADHNRWSWEGEGHSEAFKDTFREQVRIVLEAVAPALLAMAWDEGWSAGYGEGHYHACSDATNPYRTATP